MVNRSLGCLCMKNVRFLFVCFYVLAIATGCVPDTSTKNTEINFSLNDVVIQKILEFQDQQRIDSLFRYFSHENPSYRYQAVLAFASIKDVTANDSLVKMLQDPILQVRSAAAFALGQSGDHKVTDRLIAAFKGKDTLEVNNIFNRNILEAVGKTGGLNDLKAIASVKTYRSTDTLLLLGQSHAIYQMALRKITCDEGTNVMVDLLAMDKIPQNIRLVAASYLARAEKIDLSLAKIRLIGVYNKEKNPYIKMALAIAFGNSQLIDFLPVLHTALTIETDYRIKCNILRAFVHFPYLEIKEQTINYLKNDNIHVASTAADVILKNGIMEDVPLYASFDTVTIPWQVRAKMNGAVLNHTALYFTKSKTAFSERIIKNMKAETSMYGKAAYVDALSKDPFNYALLIQLYAEQKEPILKASALQGLGNVLKSPMFFKAFGNNFGRVKSEILNVLTTAIQSKEIGQITVAAGIIKDPSLQWKEWLKDLTFLKDAMTGLTLPKEIETYNELKSCIAELEGQKFIAEKPKFNHAIDWTLLQTVGDSSIAAIKTTKGLIRVQLFKNVAPATVINFVRLVQDNFYADKTFHRVVPNFVVQTGCPRGDGYGSLDYSIRSELPQVYYDQEGYIGMASSGNHTECTQWFITHSPTMHLNGNYTLFGKVVEGMDVIHNIQQGDKIVEIIFVK